MPRSPRLLLAVLTLLILLLVIAGFVLGWYALRLEARDTRKQSAQLDVVKLVLDARFLAADMNGWQTAYAFEVRRGKSAAAQDSGAARAQFLRAAALLREKFAQLERVSVGPEQRAALNEARANFERFTELDKAVVQAYRSGEETRMVQADALVLNEEVALFGRLSEKLDAVVLAMRLQAAEAADATNQINRDVRRWLAALAFLSIALSAFLVWLVARALAKRDALARQLDTLARTDALTGVANRRAWDEELLRALERSKRTQQPLCVVLVDLDYFKKFNDEHGHQAGDRLLSDMSAAFTAELRKDDQIARYGGEEFALLLNGCDAAQARATLERLSKVMPQRQTFSAGIVQCDGSEDPRDVVALADRAMYKAKSTGRKRAVIADKGAMTPSAAPGGKAEPEFKARR